MASKRIPVVLAVEIDAAWPTAITGRPAAGDRRDGRSESHMGRGTDCVGTALEAGDSRIAAHRAAVHAFGPDPGTGQARRRGAPLCAITRARCSPATSS